VNRAITALGILAALAVAAGCTTTSAGEPRPQETSTNSSDPTGSESGDLPPRPREVTLDNVNPCTLIPQADESEYYIEEPGEPGEDDEGNAQCTWIGTEVGYFGFTLDVSEGIETRLDGTYTVVGEVADPILDFGTVTYGLSDDEGACFAAVDVADGQQLIAEVGIDGPYLDEVPPICEYAHQLATSAMETLVES
jgi:hypothetical protein